MSIREIASQNIPKIEQNQNINKEKVEDVNTQLKKTEKVLGEVCSKFHEMCMSFTSELDSIEAELNGTQNKIGERYFVKINNKIDGLCKKVIVMSDLYESLYIEKVKKKLQEDYANKQKEIKDYKDQKRKILEDLADNFAKLG